MSPQNCGPNGDPLVNQQYCAKQSHDNHLHIRDIFSSDYRGNPILPNPTVFPTPPIRYNSMASVPTPVFHKITLVDRESLYRVAVTLFLGSALYLCLRSFYLWLDADVRLLPSPIFERPHWLWGHEMITFINSAGKKYTEWFNTLGPVFRIRGALFHGDIIVTADPAMVNHILIKNVYDYEKSPMIRPVAERLVGRGLVWAEGDDHKRQRKLLNPAFTNEHIRNMAPDVTECTERYIAALEAHLLNQPTKETEVDMQEWNAKVTLDIIGRTGFGFDFGLGSSPEAQHILKGWHNQATQGFSKTTMMGMAFLRLCPSLSSAPAPPLKAQEAIRDRIRTSAKTILEEARQGRDVNARATDMISVLLKSKNGLTNDELLDNIVTFVVAGHETTAGVLSYTLHALAKKPEVQEKLLQELRDFKAENLDEEPTYDDYMSQTKMPYLDAVTKEALRLFPAAAYTERIATKDDVLPLQNPILTPSGQVLSSMKVKAGQSIYLPVIAMNRLNMHWGDADNFRPERWLPENAATLPGPSSLPGGWNGSITFSAGPRLCIGYRLALFEYKILLMSMLRKFNLHDSGIEMEYKHCGSLQPRVIGREHEGVQFPVVMSLRESDD